MRHFVFFVVALAACSSKSIPTAATGDATAPPAEATSAAPATSAEPSGHIRLGVGVFVDERLIACVDYNFTYKTKADADAYRERIKKTTKDTKGETLFLEGCATSFADRPVLATCTTKDVMKDGSPLGTTTLGYYTIEALGKDAQMRKCHDGDGKWEALSRSSPEYEKADIEAQLRKNEADLKKLQGH